MKVHLGVRSSGSLERRSRAAIRHALDKIILKRALPKARAAAPGSIGRQLRAVHAVEIADGVYEVGISMPRKYWVVEYGSGVYVGRTGWSITPRIDVDDPKRVLALADGRFAARVFVLGQRPQAFIRTALKESLEDFGQEVIYGFNAGDTGGLDLSS